MVPAVKTIFGAQCTGMRLTCLVAVILVIPLAGVSAVRPSNRSPAALAIRSLAANRGLNEGWRGGPGAVGPRVVRTQILPDRVRFSPGEIDGVYGNDFGIAVKGYQKTTA